MVVIKSALELKRGFTKLSGSNPSLNAIKEAETAIKLTSRKEKKFASRRRPKMSQ